MSDIRLRHKIIFSMNTVFQTFWYFPNKSDIYDLILNNYFQQCGLGNALKFYRRWNKVQRWFLNQPRSLISAFVVRLLQSIIYRLATSKISIF